MIGEQEKDLQIVIDLVASDFDIKIKCGPIHKDEAGDYFGFSSDHFKECGVYLDIDVSKTKSIQQSEISKLVKEAMVLSWKRIDQISTWIGI